VKKATKKSVKLRKLVIRSEAIALLTPLELSKAAGGDAILTWPPCIESDPLAGMG